MPSRRNPTALPPQGVLPTRLLKACRSGNVDNVVTCLAAGASTVARDKLDRTPVMLAARHGHANVIRVLLSHGVSVDVSHEDGFNSLVWAAQKGHLDAVQVLLHSGASVHTADNYQLSSRMAAFMGQHDDVMALLDAFDRRKRFRRATMRLYELALTLTRSTQTPFSSTDSHGSMFEVVSATMPSAVREATRM